MQERDHQLYNTRKKELAGASSINLESQLNLLMGHAEDTELRALLERALELGKKEGQYQSTAVWLRSLEETGFPESDRLKIWAEYDNFMDRFRTANQDFKDNWDGNNP